MKYQAPRGTNDIVPAPRPTDPIFESHRWHAAEESFRQAASSFGYQEIRLPLFEDYELFVRSSGETSEIVDKEMYDFRDKGDRHIALRPELTAPTMRAYLENHLGVQGSVTRLFYYGPVFRYGRQGKGRFRQFHQAGLELIGSASPLADAEIIELSYGYLTSLGLTDLNVMLNCIGRAETRERYGKAILGHVEAWLATQDEDGRAKAHKNPLRLLDTKDPNLRNFLQGVPSILDFLEDSSKSRFEAIQSDLADAGVPFEVKADVVRGLDYYTDTVFEIVGATLGDLSLCGGGRYDNLIEEMGGPAIPSVGVGFGLERILLSLEDLKAVPEPPRMAAYVVAAEESARPSVRGLVRKLRQAGLSAQADIDDRSLKSQFKQADRSGARYAIVIGEEEMATSQASVKDLATSQQSMVGQGDLVAWLRASLS